MLRDGARPGDIWIVYKGNFLVYFCVGRGGRKIDTLWVTSGQYYDDPGALKKSFSIEDARAIWKGLKLFGFKRLDRGE